MPRSGRRDARPSSSASAATGFSPVTQTIARPSLPLNASIPQTQLWNHFYRETRCSSFSYITLSYESPSSQREPHTPTNSRHKTPSAGAARSPARLRRAGRDVALPSKSPSAGLRSPARRGCPAPSPLSPAGSSGSSPDRASLPAPRGAALTGLKELSAAAQRQPGEGQDGGEGGRLHRQRPPGRAAPRSQAAAPALRGWRAAGKERKVREAEALQHVSCKCAPARCRVADEDPITSHVTGKDRDRHPNLLPQRGTAGLPLPPLTPAGPGWRLSPRGSAVAPQSPPSCRDASHTHTHTNTHINTETPPSQQRPSLALVTPQ